MRTHLCGEVTEKLADQSVQLCGWVDRRRDLGGLIFIGLRDHAGVVQVVVEPDSPAFADAESLRNPNVVKVVLDHAGNALYFSRAPIPYPRDHLATDSAAFPAGLPSYRHIGIYAYRAGFLRIYGALEQAAIERFEALEQLRALWHGYRIAVAVTAHAPEPGVDTAEDLERARRSFAADARSTQEPVAK